MGWCALSDGLCDRKTRIPSAKPVPLRNKFDLAAAVCRKIRFAS
ncbi:hypothetical protein [Kingella potus]|nr:hypothetical protein [Kingella potus]